MNNPTPKRGRGRPPNRAARVGLLDYIILGGGTVKQWAYARGVTPSVVNKWLHSLGLRKQWLTPEEWAHLQQRRSKARRKAA